MRSRGFGDHRRIDRAVRDGAQQRLALGLRAWSRLEQQRRATSSIARVEFVGNGEIVQQAETECFGRGEPLRGQEQAARRPCADRLDDVGADRRGNEPEPRFRKCEHRVLRADGDVATGDEPDAAADRRRHGHARPSVWEARSGSPASSASAFASARFCAREKPAIFFIQLQVGASAEARPGADEHHRAHRGSSARALRSAAVSSAISVSSNAL